MVKKASKADSTPGFLRRTGIFGFELFMALFGLVTTLMVVDYGIFALFNYLVGDKNSSSMMGEFTVWIVAALVVWLPVTIIFYLRSRSEAERVPVRSESGLYKVLTSLYYFSVIVGAIILAFIAIYALVRTAVNPDESITEVMTRVVGPALVAVLVHVGMMFAYSRHKSSNKYTFASIFGGVAALLVIALLALSIGLTRGAKQDEIAVSDLGNIRTAIEDYNYDNGKIPASLSDLSFVSKKTADRLSNYEYSRIDDLRYELCADFVNDTRDDDGFYAYPSSYLNKDYNLYQSFNYHDDGRVCFKLRAEAITKD